MINPTLSVCLKGTIALWPGPRDQLGSTPIALTALPTSCALWLSWNLSNCWTVAVAIAEVTVVRCSCSDCSDYSDYGDYSDCSCSCSDCSDFLVYFSVK